VHILPTDGPKAMWEITQGKTTSIPFSLLVGTKVSRKHPRMFYFTMFREDGNKRYDFEATTKDEAAEIQEELNKGMKASLRS